MSEDETRDLQAQRTSTCIQLTWGLTEETGWSLMQAPETLLGQKQIFYQISGPFTWSKYRKYCAGDVYLNCFVRSSSSDLGYSTVLSIQKVPGSSLTSPVKRLQAAGLGKESRPLSPPDPPLPLSVTADNPDPNRPQAQPSIRQYSLFVRKLLLVNMCKAAEIIDRHLEGTLPVLQLVFNFYRFALSLQCPCSVKTSCFGSFNKNKIPGFIC